MQTTKISVKQFLFLKRKPTLTHEQFRAKWCASNARLMVNDAKSKLRHVRNLIEQSSNPVFAWDAYDGIAERWCRDERLTELSQAQYDGVLLDLHKSSSVVAREVRVLDRHGGKIKFMSLLRRKVGLSHEEFSEYWATKHAPLVETVHEVYRYFRGYVQNHCIPGSGRLLDGTEGGFNIDGIVEIWFDNLSDLVNAMASARYMEVLRPDEAKFVALPNTRLLVLEEDATY